MLFTCILFSQLSLAHTIHNEAQQDKLATNETPPPPSKPEEIMNTVKKAVADARDGKQTTESILDKRVDRMKESNNNPFSISQYRQNYLLPFSYAKAPNPISVDGLTEENVDKFEAKYQISVNLPLYLQDDDVSGVFFGIGLVIAGMTNPAKVMGFLNVFGNWDPSLIFVMGGAIAVSMPVFLISKKMSAPLFNKEEGFNQQLKKNIDSPLIIGSLIFGIGWALDL